MSDPSDNTEAPKFKVPRPAPEAQSPLSRRAQPVSQPPKPHVLSSLPPDSQRTEPRPSSHPSEPASNRPGMDRVFPDDPELESERSPEAALGSATEALSLGPVPAELSHHLSLADEDEDEATVVTDALPPEPSTPEPVMTGAHPTEKAASAYPSDPRTHSQAIYPPPRARHSSSGLELPPMSAPSVKPPAAAPPPAPDPSTPPPSVNSSDLPWSPAQGKNESADTSSTALDLFSAEPASGPPPTISPVSETIPDPAGASDPDNTLPGSRSKERKPLKPWLWVAAASVALAAMLTLIFGGSSGPGRVLIAVTGPGSTSVGDLRILVDGEPRCEVSPCSVELPPGRHQVAVEAAAFPPPGERAVDIRASEDSVLNIQLSAPPLAELSVTAVAEGLEVLVDGKSYGQVPANISDLAPGEHVVELTGPNFKSLRETVSLIAGEHQALGPLSPTPLSGVLRLEGDGPMEVYVDGHRIKLPYEEELDASIPHEVKARRNGYKLWRKELHFSAAQRSIAQEIVLEKKEPKDSSPGSAPTKKNPRSATSQTKVGKKDGQLTLVSTPQASVLLDGSPMGKTPRRGLAVSRGLHTITFVHPKRGRKTIRVSVPSGGSKTITNKF